MNLITDNWRLKLLAVGLAVLMLGAVAFAQNPPRTRTLSVGLNYTVPSDLVLIDPPLKTNVTISGLADVIATVTPENLVATADAGKAKPGPQVELAVTVKSLVSGVDHASAAPVVVNVDLRQQKQVPVQVNARAAPGWSITQAQALCPSSPCTVTFDGPATWVINLTASVVVSQAVSVGVFDAPNEPVLLQNSNGLLDYLSCQTRPCAGLDIANVSVHIEARPGSTSSTVALVDSPPSQPPPAGYRVTGIAISPVTVVIAGDAAAIGRIQRIVLPPVDLSGRTTDYTIQVTIPYPDGVSSSVVTARITYSISANPNIAPSP
jgi:YbbR domain-containing protein